MAPKQVDRRRVVQGLIDGATGVGSKGRLNVNAALHPILDALDAWGPPKLMCILAPKRTQDGPNRELALSYSTSVRHSMTPKLRR